MGPSYLNVQVRWTPMGIWKHHGCGTSSKNIFKKSILAEGTIFAESILMNGSWILLFSRLQLTKVVSLYTWRRTWNLSRECYPSYFLLARLSVLHRIEAEIPPSEMVLWYRHSFLKNFTKTKSEKDVSISTFGCFFSNVTTKRSNV